MNCPSFPRRLGAHGLLGLFALLAHPAFLPAQAIQALHLHLLDAGPNEEIVHVGGGLYQGSWLVPEGFREYGLMVAEARVAPQASIYNSGYWVERNWAFLSDD